jgi:hypothetical protein
MKSGSVLAVNETMADIEGQLKTRGNSRAAPAAAPTRDVA